MSALTDAKQRLEAHVNAQRRQLAWAAKHLADYTIDGGQLGDTDLHELRIALLTALAGTLEVEEIAADLALHDDTEQAVRQ